MGSYVENWVTFRSEKNNAELQELARYLLTRKNLKIDKLLIQIKKKKKGFSEQYAFEPTIDDYFSAIKNLDVIEVYFSTKWFAPNRLFKRICDVFTGITICNTWSCPDLGAGEDHWSKKDFEGYDEDDFEDDEEILE